MSATELSNADLTLLAFGFTKGRNAALDDIVAVLSRYYADRIEQSRQAETRTVSLKERAALQAKIEVVKILIDEMQEAARRTLSRDDILKRIDARLGPQSS